jgi:hypothetical protein
MPPKRASRPTVAQRDALTAHATGMMMTYLSIPSDDSDSDDDAMDTLRNIMLVRYAGANRMLRLYHQPNFQLSHVWPTEGHFGAQQFENYFRLTIGEFHIFFHVCTAAGIPNEVCIRERIDHQGRSRNEFAPWASCLLLMLRRLRHPNVFHDLELLFGHHITTLSRAFITAVNVFHSVFSGLTKRNIPFLLSRVALYVKAFEPSLCIGFIDGTARQICVPTYEQMVFYSGNHRMHCLQWQGICTPDGFLHLSGPFAGRHTDRQLLAYSEHTELLQAGLGDNSQVYFVADGIYPAFAYSWLHSTSHSTLQTDLIWRELRASVEHLFGNVVRKWSFVNYHGSQQVFLGNPQYEYETATTLCNMLNCLRPNQVAQKFGFHAHPELPLLRDFVSSGVLGPVPAMPRRRTSAE